MGKTPKICFHIIIQTCIYFEIFFFGCPTFFWPGGSRLCPVGPSFQEQFKTQRTKRKEQHKITLIQGCKDLQKVTSGLTDGFIIFLFIN